MVLGSEGAKKDHQAPLTHKSGNKETKLQQDLPIAVPGPMREWSEMTGVEGGGCVHMLHPPQLPSPTTHPGNTADNMGELQIRHTVIHPTVLILELLYHLINM